ncbi:MAG: 4'-phosphopantetheinyl transferase superfamily protein [Pseudomonadales bacterium]
MDWIFDKPELASFRIADLQLGDCVLAVCEVADYRDSLVGTELDALGNMSAMRRQRSYTSGRHCVRLAQRSLGLELAAIEREERMPLWPQGSGSITHSDNYAACVLSTAQTGLGLDMEEFGRVDEPLWRLVFTEQEKRNMSSDLATIAFSAKEAGYKAIYPHGRKFINFHEAEVDIDTASQTFSIRYLGEHPPNQALNEGQGAYQIAHGHVLTFFCIDLCRP